MRVKKYLINTAMIPFPKMNKAVGHTDLQCLLSSEEPSLTEQTTG